ncbi:uncharacterized protein LOC124646249 [Helicoverpa zea]|uniref:uncharacterized protein LOC124646249 n=1 Tax=Helicoverpa zea TaxID=7113 RepID=UPI001F58506F|nr:uncharacterized protein LOC124646249 [Helicoverpa zea]
MNFLVVSVLICVLVEKISTYKTFSALNSIVFTNIASPKQYAHSEYYFGKCAIHNKELLGRDLIKSDKMIGSRIVRGQLNLTDNEPYPNCVYIRATSAFGDMVRFQTYAFNVCFVKILHNHRAQIFTYHFYEWFIPAEMAPGITWEIFFFRV